MPVTPDAREGMLAVDGEGGFTRVVDGLAVPFEVPATQAGELAALLGLRDTVVTLLDLEAAERADTPAMRALRGELTARYEAYLGEFGALGRYTLRPTGRVDAAGEPRHARVYPRHGGFRTDPYASAVYALESGYDPAATDDSGGPGASLVRADIFSRRVIAPRAPRTRAESPADALAICLDEHAHVDLDRIAALLERRPRHRPGPAGRPGVHRPRHQLPRPGRGVPLGQRARQARRRPGRPRRPTRPWASTSPRWRRSSRST